MNEPGVLERVKVREALGIFASTDAANPAVEDLLMTGFDRADIDVVARDGQSGVVRREFVAPEDTSLVFALCVGVVGCLAAMIGAFTAIGSGGTTMHVVIRTILAGAVGCGLGLLLAHRLGWRWIQVTANSPTARPIALCARVRTAERERQALQILEGRGAAAVRVQEVEMDKRLEDLPLSSLRPDPWLSDEPLGQP